MISLTYQFGTTGDEPAAAVMRWVGEVVKAGGGGMIDANGAQQLLENVCKVCGWGVYCCDFPPLPMSPSVFCSRQDPLTTLRDTNSRRLPPSPAVS